MIAGALELPHELFRAGWVGQEDALQDQPIGRPVERQVDHRGDQGNKQEAPARDLFEEYERRLAAILARILRTTVADPSTMRPSAEARARILIAAAHGFKATATNGGELRRLFVDLVEMTVGPTQVERAHDPSRRPPRRQRKRDGKRG